ncbi:MAG: DNA double-strand break repair nuclease NurA [Candidatus Dependentiae bacterium]
MLHYAKVMQALTDIKGELFTDISKEISIARASWQRIANDPEFQKKAHAISSPWVVPSWTDAIDKTFDVAPLHEPYQVVSVDGSQIYPDRHQGTSCYLINVGTIVISYGMQHQPFVYNSIPYVYAGRNENEADDNLMDVVNARRQELELQYGLDICQPLFNHEVPQTFLFDGSLIFWHLASKSPNLKDHYIARYLGLMHQLYAARILHGGYISLSKGKDLVNLIRMELCNFLVKGCTEHKVMDHISDSTIAGFFLKVGQRSIVFKSHSPICDEYPEHLMPYFFYLHVGDEIARIEVPAWIAQDEENVNAVARIMYDQAQKGNGYPVALAEAHEQAVVKGPDREFFYQMVNKLAIDFKKRMFISQKSSKKRVMGI